MATHVSDTGSKGRSRGSSADELALIAQRAQAFTNASGTAIALSEGNLDEIVCRARSGTSAPDVGTALRVEGSFTGLCIQSGKELRCDDAETDTRVDTTAIRALGIRSMVVTPIKEENRVVGVLAVFAPTAHAFTITHVAVLKTMADQISALLQKERRAKEEGAGAEPASPPAAAAAPHGAVAPTPHVAVASMPQATLAAPSAPPPVMITPAAPSAPLAAPVPRPSFPVISKKIEPIKTTPVAEEIATPLVIPSREEKPRAEVRPNLTTFDAASEEKKSGVSLILVGVVALVVVGAASTFAVFKLRKPTLGASTLTPRVQEPQSSVVPPTAGAASVAPASATNNSPSASPVTPGGSTAAKPAPENNSSEASRRTERTPARNSVPETRNSVPEARNSVQTSAPDRSTPDRSTPEKRPSPETVAIAAAPSKIGLPSDSGAAPESTPSLNLGGSSGSGALSALAKPADASKPSMLTQSNLEPVQVLKRVAPVYPAIAKQRRLSGILVVQATVGKDGKISNLVLESGPPVFRDAAFEAVRQWQFKPATLNGQPIEQSTTIKLQFNP
jgi:TonB family protein